MNWSSKGHFCVQTTVRNLLYKHIETYQNIFNLVISQRCLRHVTSTLPPIVRLIDLMQRYLINRLYSPIFELSGSSNLNYKLSTYII